MESNALLYLFTETRNNKDFGMKGSKSIEVHSMFNEFVQQWK